MPCAHVTLMFVQDSMTVVFPRHKGDLDGKSGMVRHVFANTTDPSINPILAVGVYMFCCFGSRPASATNLLFGHLESEKRFNKWLLETVKKVEGELAEQSTAVKDIGSHSFRKGTATYLAAMVGGPSPVSIYLRAGWSLGVQKRYILEGGGNDQLAGRAAAGLDINSVRIFGTFCADLTACTAVL